MKRRCRYDLIAEILMYAECGRLKTDLMYGVNLSYKQTEKYLKILLDSGLLEPIERKKRTIYITTRRGTHFIHQVAELKELLGEGSIEPWIEAAFVEF